MGYTRSRAKHHFVQSVLMEGDDFMKGKKMIALLGAALCLQTGAACNVGGMDFGGNALLSPAIVHAEKEPAWQADIDEASRDDTMAFGLYIGKPLQSFIDDCTAKGWERLPSEKAVFFRAKKDGYMIGIAVHPNTLDKNLAGSYRIRFYAKTENEADEMFMRAEKNFAYNFGRPSIKKGMANMTWFLNDSFAILVEYNVYDPRMPITEGYPYEIVIKRDIGDYKKFFEPGKSGI